MTRSTLWITATLLAPAALNAQKIAISGKRVHTTSTQGTIRDGVVLVDGRSILRVGPREDVEIPPNFQRLEAEVVTPGFVDAHSVVGLAGLNNVRGDQDQLEESGPNQADLRAIDGFHPNAPLVRYLLRFGVTVVHAGPGPSNPIAGQTGIFKTHGRTVDDMVVRFPATLAFNLGELPKSTYGPHKPPGTRMGTAALIRRSLNDAVEYGKRLARSESVGGNATTEPFERDLRKEALLDVVRGKVPALITAHREDDLLTALRIAREFDLRLILDGATEAYLVRQEIAKGEVPVIVHPTMQRVARLETFNTSLENAGLLADAGIAIAFQSGYESYVPKTRVVLFEAAVAMVNGLGFDRTLRALTLGGAEILGIADRVGSLEPGKDADIVLFDGDPFEFTTHVEAVVVNGEVAWRREAR